MRDIDKWNIGGRYNTMSLMKFSKDSMEAVIKLIDQIENMGGWG